MYTVSSELIAKIRTYIVTLSSLHNELFLIHSKHIKQIKGEKKRRKKKPHFSYFCRSKASDTEYMFKKSYIYLSSYCLYTTLIDWALFLPTTLGTFKEKMKNTIVELENMFFIQVKPEFAVIWWAEVFQLFIFLCEITKDLSKTWVKHRTERGDILWKHSYISYRWCFGRKVLEKRKKILHEMQSCLNVWIWQYDLCVLGRAYHTWMHGQMAWCPSAPALNKC